MHCKLHKKQIDMLKKGDKVKTWISTKIGEVVDYNEQTQQVTVKTKGSRGLDVMPLKFVQKV